MGGRFAGCDQRLSRWGEAKPRAPTAVVAARGKTDRLSPVTSIGSGVFELRDADPRAWYRVLYLSRINDVIYVLHCFEKKSRALPRNDAEIAKQRLKRVKARLTEEKKYGKR
jgi:phage-related protein